jgi:uncharacterized protein (DUF433 family)
MSTAKLFEDAAPELGGGIFLISDISTILHLPYPKVRRWIIEFWDKRFGKQSGFYSFGEPGSLSVNFYTFIEFAVFAELRKEGISSQRIQKYYQSLGKKLQTKYPFAHYRISTDGKNLWYEQFDNLVRLDGKDQFDFKPIIQGFLKKIEFGEDKLAKRFFPLGGKSKNVVIDPNHQFGQPTIAGTNLKTKTIYNLYKAGERSEDISDLYNISLKKVKDAIYFHKNAA